MFEITHQKAHDLMQASADQPLGAEEKSALGAHLAKCKECSDYAKSLAGLESRLRKSLHAQWDDHLPDLNQQAIMRPPLAKLIWDSLFSQTNTMGKVTILAALLLGYFMIANLFGIQLPISGNETPTIVPIPNELALTLAISSTPSAQFSLTGLSMQACETFIYNVQANDTLESIAMQHGTTKEAILEYNQKYTNLATNTVYTGMDLIIPLCKSTPSRTATTTITPLSGTIFPVQPE